MTDQTKQIDWLLNEVIPGFETANLPPSWKADALRRSHQQVADIQWMIDNNAPAPACGWTKPYAEHGANGCPKGNHLCAAQFGVKLQRATRKNKPLEPDRD